MVIIKFTTKTIIKSKIIPNYNKKYNTAKNKAN